MIARHRARRLALQGLCCLDVQGPAARPNLREFFADSDEDPVTRNEAAKMLDVALQRRDEADAIMTRHAKHWDLQRLAMVDRNVLRLTIAEMLDGRTPAKVAITEGIKLAQEFSTAESPRFINGILDAVARELGGEKQEE
ncbi:MAG: transcription antitermination factor NusB [Planctomycetaceae bacterium]|nr:transcription antitermination factor NusB [Planctomycetaceae bacterium]